MQRYKHTLANEKIKCLLTCSLESAGSQIKILLFGRGDISVFEKMRGSFKIEVNNSS